MKELNLPYQMSPEEENALEFKKRMELLEGFSYEEELEMLPRCARCNKIFSYDDLVNERVYYVGGDTYHQDCLPKMGIKLVSTLIPEQCTIFWNRFKEDEHPGKEMDEKRKMKLRRYAHFD